MLLQLNVFLFLFKPVDSRGTGLTNLKGRRSAVVREFDWDRWMPDKPVFKPIWVLVVYPHCPVLVGSMVVSLVIYIKRLARFTIELT